MILRLGVLDLGGEGKPRASGDDPAGPMAATGNGM